MERAQRRRTARALGGAMVQTPDGPVHPLVIQDRKINALMAELRVVKHALGVVVAMATGVATPTDEGALALLKRLGIEVKQKEPAEEKPRLYLPAGL